MDETTRFRDPVAPENAELVMQYVSWALDRDVRRIAELPAELHGGVENRNYRLAADLAGERKRFVLRLPPEAIPEWREGDYDLGREYGILRELKAFDVGSPAAYGYDAEGQFFGCPCSMMACLPGHSLYDGLFPTCSPELIEEYASRVADLCRIDYTASPWLRDHLPRWPMERQLEWLASRARAHPHDPLVEFALCWLRERLPEPQSLVFSHGDANPSNFLITDGSITGVVDWEFACIIDHPLSQIAFFCWLYDGDLVERGFARAYCRAVGCQETDLEWFWGSAWFGVTFASGDRDVERFSRNRRRLAEFVQYPTRWDSSDDHRC